MTGSASNPWVCAPDSGEHDSPAANGESAETRWTDTVGVVVGPAEAGAGTPQMVARMPSADSKAGSRQRLTMSRPFPKLFQIYMKGISASPACGVLRKWRC